MSAGGGLSGLSGDLRGLRTAGTARHEPAEPVGTSAHLVLTFPRASAVRIRDGVRSLRVQRA